MIDPHESPEIKESFEDGFNQGLEAVTAIRCVAHRAVPRYNGNGNKEADAECGACAYDAGYADGGKDANARADGWRRQVYDMTTERNEMQRLLLDLRGASLQTLPDARLDHVHCLICSHQDGHSDDCVIGEIDAFLAKGVGG